MPDKAEFTTHPHIRKRNILTSNATCKAFVLPRGKHTSMLRSRRQGRGVAGPERSSKRFKQRYYSMCKRRSKRHATRKAQTAKFILVSDEKRPKRSSSRCGSLSTKQREEGTCRTLSRGAEGTHGPLEKKRRERSAYYGNIEVT